jgi:dinuclear metal center YbgI/SA1388 family protein
MNLRDITSFLEMLAPLAFQEDYDNSGLIVGQPDKELTGALISLDCTESVIDEAIHLGLNLIISHHPIVFKGLKRFNGRTYVERVVMKAIKHDIAIYAIHTNLDHVSTGVNKKICDKLGIKNPAVLKPREDSLRKLVTFCPENFAEELRETLFKAGAGHIGNYSECSYNVIGLGTFKAGEGTKPFVGEHGKQHHESEIRIEIIYPVNLEQKILAALIEKHPYEAVAYDLYSINNSHPQVGSGMIGNLESDYDELEFLTFVKEKLGAKVIRHTALRSKKVRRVAVCGGSGSFLLPNAISAGADVFISADFKYHEFFDAEDRLVLMDAGHFETEQFTSEGIVRKLSAQFPNIAVLLSETKTNPVLYA